MSTKLETDITLNLKGDLARKARRYGNSMSEFARRTSTSMMMINRSVAAASKGIDSLGNRTILGAGVAAVAFERTFIKTAASFEKMRTSMESLMGSEAGGQKALEWIEKFTQSTPYSVEEVTQSFIRLKAYGLDPMDGSLQSIADQVSKMGGNAEMVDGVAMALGQAWTKGKLQAEELNQMLERGVPVYEYLQKASKELGHNSGQGFSREQLQKMSESGKLTRDTIRDLIRVMGEESEGSALRQMKTWNGMISNIGDHWMLFQRDVMNSGAFEMLKGELGEFLSMLDQMKSTGEYDELVDKVGTNLVESFKTAANAARGLKEVGDGLLPVLKAVGTGAQAISEAVGGYGNLAKILASIYAINKAASIASPILQGGASAGGWIYDKARGTKKGHGVLASKVSTLTATPVFVTNWPTGGIVDDLIGSGNHKSNSKKTSKLGRGVGAASALGTLGLLFSAKEYDPTTPMFTPMSFPADIPSNTSQLSESMAKFNQGISQQVNSGRSNSWVTAGQRPQDGNIHLTMEVTDDRVKVTPKYVPKGFTIDPDMGVN